VTPSVAAPGDTNPSDAIDRLFVVQERKSTNSKSLYLSVPYACVTIRGWETHTWVYTLDFPWELNSIIWNNKRKRQKRT